MATGRSFRQRPLDAHKVLPIVRDETLLDSIEGLPAKDSVKMEIEAAPKADPKPVDHPPAQKPEGGKEIPIPGVTRVPTYDLDYLPAFKERNTYLRGRGGIGYEDPTLVEYDLDAEDELWLAQYNRDQERLSADKFETMLWRLDVANAEATDKSFAFQGAAPAERLTREVCGTTEFLTRDNALQMLEETCPSRNTIRVAIYDYWIQKRNKLKQPLLRRLQAPTPLNNQDPFRVFRPRDRRDKPTTRRRRENNVDSYEKLRMISDNIKMALELFENVVKRERKKRDMTYVMTDWQQLQIKQRFDLKSDQDMVEQEYLTAVKSKSIRRPVGFEGLPEAAPPATNALLDFRNKKNKKRKRLGFEPQLNAVAQLPPLPAEPQPDFTFITGVDPLKMHISQVDVSLHTSLKHRQWSCRIGRGGRLVIDRCRPFTWDPLGGEDDKTPRMHEMTNPYLQWANKSDLAQAAMARMELAAPSTVVKLRLPVASSAEAQEDLKASGDEPDNGQPSHMKRISRQKSAS